MCIDITPSRLCTDSKRQSGVSLVELVMFIVIVGVAVLGILSVMNITVGHSADPMTRKQALAIAESLMEEITLQSFTYCDPDDSNAPIATGTGDCSAGMNQDNGPRADETRYVEPRFDNVRDYHGFAMNGIRRLDDGSLVGGLQGYNASVSVTEDARGGIAAPDSLRIDVTVTAPGIESITLTGYRFRYAPRALP